MVAVLKVDNKPQFVKACQHYVGLGYAADPPHFQAENVRKCLCTSGDAQLPNILIRIRKQGNQPAGGGGNG